MRETVIDSKPALSETVLQAKALRKIYKMGAVEVMRCVRSIWNSTAANSLFCSVRREVANRHC